MPLTITPETKNNITITNEDKPSSNTWADMNVAWEDANRTWDEPGLIVVNETKNNITITNEDKS